MTLLLYPINLNARSLRIVNKVSSGCLEYLRTRPTKKRSLAKITLTEDENDSNDGIPKYLIVLKGFFFIYLRGKLRCATRDHFPYK